MSPYIKKETNQKKSLNAVWHQTSVSHNERVQANGHKPAVLWFTGLSGSGKSTLANTVDKLLYDMGCHTYVLDGDNVRYGLNSDLSFSDKDRVENIRRIGEVSRLMYDAGLIVSVAFISPFAQDRAMVRNRLGDHAFIEVFIDTPLEICEQRDPKGLYKKARAGEIKKFTGIDSDYERPLNPEIHLLTENKPILECACKVIEYLKANQYIT